MPDTDRYFRSDLSALKALPRQGVFEALRSFDDRGMERDAFVLRTAALLDAGRVPGLEQARQDGDPSKVLAAVMRACAPQKTTVVDGKAIDDDVLALAENALENRFTFYGETHQLPERIDWDANPGTAHWGHDLNRFSYLGALTRAYRATGERRFARKAVTLITDWIEAADMSLSFRGTPYVFGSYLNQAIHCGAWAVTIRELSAEGCVEPLELLRILKSLHDQLAYLEIVTNGHGGNWPTIGCMGMLRTVASLPVLRDTDRWVAYCRDALATQIREQVLPGGVQDELTPHYHRVVINNLLTAQEALLALGTALHDDTLATLRDMLHYSQQMTVPDRSKQVAFNDSDPGAVADWRGRLERIGLEDMLLPETELVPRIYPYAGVALLRQPATEGDLYLAFDAGPFGRAHQHEDKLGFWLFAYGRNLIVDPGRHLYDWSEASFFPYLRSTTAHSTIRIDGQDQHNAGRQDTWIARKPLDLGWQRDGSSLRAQGVYDLGYGRDNALKVTHRREIVFAAERFWVIFDRVEGEGEHDIEARCQFAPGDVTVEDGRARTLFEDANLLVIPAVVGPLPELRVEKGLHDPRAGWYSDAYGKIEPAPALAVRLRAGLPVRMAVLLYPYRGAVPPEVTFAFDGERAQVHGAETGPIAVQCRLP